jgi:hypothetical protein
MSASRVFGLVVVSSWLVLGCSSSAKKIDVGGTCMLNSDCNGTLVCTMGKCHDACHASTDCPIEQRCVKANNTSICQLATEAQCRSTPCDTAFVCASDLQCRTPCQAVGDCANGQLCVTNVCADPSDLDVNGQLPQKSTGDGGGADTRSVDTGTKDSGSVGADVLGTGGVINAGGASGTGGVVGTGGIVGTGGSAGSGGNPGAGGTTTQDAANADQAAERPDGASDVSDGNADSPISTTKDGGASTVLTGCGKVTTKRYFCDDFESGLDNWHHATEGWGLTTATSQSATHSVTDSPNGNYPKGANSEITMVSSVDLTGAVSPVVTFWHLLSLNSYYAYPGCEAYASESDGTYVDVSSDGGTTWTVLTSYICSSNTTVWSFQQLSLASYAGKKIKLRFRLNSAYGGTDGWYVDDVEIRETDLAPTASIDAGSQSAVTAEPTGCDGAPVAGRYFCEDFETTTDLTTYWQVAINGWNTLAATSQSPTHSVTDSPSGNYPAGAKSDMTMISSVDLTGATSPIVTFWHKLSLNSYYTYPGCEAYTSESDGTYVDVSSDGGTTWTVLTSYICSSNTTVWSFQQLSLASYAGMKIKLRFRLNGPYGGADGWYIDDIKIRENEFVPASSDLALCATQAAGGACNGADMCGKTCGPDAKGSKSLTCAAAKFVESTCTFPAGADYSCYKVTAAQPCAAGTKAGQACTATACQACGATTGTGYLDTNGATKQGFCVCSKGVWSCGSTAEWPCYPNPLVTGATVPTSCN